MGHTFYYYKKESASLFVDSKQIVWAKYFLGSKGCLCGTESSGLPVLSGLSRKCECGALWVS